MTITSVKFEGEGVVIGHYRREDNLRHTGEAVTAQGIYSPDLYRAVQGLRDIVESTRGLPKAWVENAEVKGISVQYDANDSRTSFVPKITINHPDWGSVLNLAPRINESEFSDFGREQVNAVISEARAFVDGTKRVDPELPLEDAA